MQPPHSRQIFFLPDEFKRKQDILRAESFNLAHTLLNRTDSEYLFVPIRSMQYLAVIDGHDFWFIDSQAYAVRDNQGGRMITVSWHSDPGLEREALTENVPVEVVFYDQDMSDVQLRLIGEFHQAMQLIDQRYRDQQIPSEGARIIPLTLR
jgi:hypothetical protein